MRTMDPALDTEKAVASSDVTAMAVTESLQAQQIIAQITPFKISPRHKHSIRFKFSQRKLL